MSAKIAVRVHGYRPHDPKPDLRAGPTLTVKITGVIEAVTAEVPALLPFIPQRGDLVLKHCVVPKDADVTVEIALPDGWTARQPGLLVFPWLSLPGKGRRQRRRLTISGENDDGDGGSPVAFSGDFAVTVTREG